MAAVEQMEGGEVGGEDAGEAGAQEEYAQGAQGQAEEGQGVEYGQGEPEGVEYQQQGGEEYAAEGEKVEEEGMEQPKKRGGHGRRKIEIEYIDDKIRRHITFSKRKAGISKKAYELSRLTGAQVLLLISSERGQIYSFATPKLQPILVNEASKTLIEQCLNAPDPIAPLALGMPGQQMPMLPIDGSIDPNDPNQQQYAEQYADGSYAEGQHPDADQLLAMQQAAAQGQAYGVMPEGYEQQYAEGYEGQQYAEGQYAEGYEGQQYAEGYEGQEGYEQQQYAEGYEGQEQQYAEGYEGQEQQEGYEGQEGEEQGEQ